MKVLGFLLAMCVSSISLAGGQFTTGAQIYEGQAKVHPIVGLAIDQKIVGKFFVTSWAGFGSRPGEDKVTKEWASAKIGVDYRLQRMFVGMGVSFNNSPDDFSSFGQLVQGPTENSVYVKTGIKLW